MKKLLLTLLAILLIIEEWLWDFLSACGHRLISFLKLDKIERYLIQASPAVALVAILIPLLIVTPINLAAFSLLLHGLILQGLLLELLAKLLGTLLIARVFTLTKPQLLSYAVLALIYNQVTACLRWAHAKVIDTSLYQWSIQFKAQLKAKIRELLK